MRTGGALKVGICTLLAIAAATLTVGNQTTADAASTRPAVTYPADFFGISAGADMTQLSDSVLNQEMDLMKQAGVHWLRVAIPWQRVHHIKDFPEKWELIDRVINAAASRNMQVLGIVDNPPEWATKHIPSIPCSVQPPFSLKAYASFVKDLAKRYSATTLAAIELENSPNIAGTWPHPDACAYAQLLRQAYPAIKHANPAITVLNGGVGGVKNDATHIAGDLFFAQLYDHGAQGNFDAASFHPYSYPCFPSDTCTKKRSWYKIANVRDAMVANGDGDKEIWATEFGAPTNGLPNDGHVSEATQAAIMRDGMKQWRKLPYTGPFFVFNFSDNGTNPNEKNDWFGIVSKDLTHLKPAYAAYKKLATT